MSPYVGVSLFYADDGEEWAIYLRTKLGAKEYAIHSEMNRITDDPKCHIRSVNVNIFLLSPDFLDLDDWGIMKEFNPSTTIAILTGIDFRDLKLESRRKNCPEVLEWLVYGLTGSDDDLARNTSVRNMLVTIVAAYEGALHDDRFGHTGSPATPRRTSSYPVCRAQETVYQDRTSTTNYDYLPPLRQVNGLHDYIIKEDKMFVILHRQAEGSLRLHYNDNRSRVPELSNPAYVYVFPISPKEQGQSFQIVLDGHEIGKSDAKSEISAKKHSLKNKDSSSEAIDAMNNGPSPCTQQGRKTTTTCKGVQTEPGTSKSGQIDVEVTTQGQVDGHRHYGTKLEQIHDLLKDELDPAGLLCQCLGIERDLELLDEKMTSLIESMETLRHISYPMKYELKEEQVSSSWPTLLHFGAQYNLANFCDALLSNPMMHGACLTRNKNGFYPQDLARRNGHEELSEQLTLFSNYVSGGRDAKYDSGFSGCIPRLSTITLHRESQADGSVPRPHTALMAPGYIPMRGKLNEENTGGSSSYTDQTESNEEVRTPTGDINPPFTKATRTISDDGGFADEDDEDTENEYHLDDPRLSSSAHSNCSGEGNDDIFGDILNYSAEEERNLPFGRDSERFSTTSKDSSYSVGSKSSFYLDEDLTVPRHRKDIDSFLGTEHPKASPTGKKHFFGFLKKRKSSSKLAPSSSSLSTSSKTKVYSRDSNRSSNSSNSSSGGSTSTLQDAKHTDDSSVQYRDLDDHKSKARFKLFMSKAHRRQSIRIKHVLEDTNMSGPTLPPRRKINTETF